MAKKSRVELFSFLPNLSFSIKEKLKTNLITIINVFATVILIGTVSIVLLWRANTVQRGIAEESAGNLAAMSANEAQAFFSSHFDLVSSMSRILHSQRMIGASENQRRNIVNDTMLWIMGSQRNVIDIYTIWAPNALDGMDASFAGAPGTTNTGQFISGYSRDLGWIEHRAFFEHLPFLDAVGSIFGDDSGLSGLVSSPSSRIVGGREAWVIELRLPIVEDGSIIGIAGATINLEPLQRSIESIMPYGAGFTMLSSIDGILIIHPDPQLLGSDIFDDSQQPPFSGVHSAVVFQTIDAAIASQEPGIAITDSFLVICHPLSVRNPIIGTYSFTDYGGPPWMIISAIPLSTIMAPIHQQILLSIFFVIAAALVTAAIVLVSSRRLTQRAGALQREIEQSSTMRDNLRYGLFMMDQKYIIQGVYSRALEKIFSVSNLLGRNFIDLLNQSLKPGEIEGLEDYIGLVFKRTFDEDMLASINPVDEFEYVSIETGEKKSLHSNFVLAEHGKGPPFIVVTMEDITAQKELEKQLKEAEAQKEKEMRSIFQVIQLNPKILRDFIEDAEDDFDRINDMLKSKIVYQEAMVQMFQFVHALKSNALILNLEAFAAGLHSMENTIKGLQETYKNEVPFDALLELVIQLNETMKEKDLLLSSISKIDAFKKVSVEEDIQERYLLVETLSQICRKTQSALDKRVKFSVVEIDNEVLDYGPRKILKDVITQLIRNAVYHGIETPEEREAAGKSPEGEIKLSLRYKDNQIIVKLSDDGKGLDFDTIKKKAEAQNLISGPEMANEKDLLKVLFAPGFSTKEYADFHAGRGIGLSLVKDRIKELHGNITVSTSPGKSTTFTISIPMELPAPAGNVS